LDWRREPRLAQAESAFCAYASRGTRSNWKLRCRAWPQFSFKMADDSIMLPLSWLYGTISAAAEGGIAIMRRATHVIGGARNGDSPSWRMVRGVLIEVGFAYRLLQPRPPNV